MDENCNSEVFPTAQQATPKKGRKPKSKSSESDDEKSNNSQDEAGSSTTNGSSAKAKRGRKPKQVFMCQDSNMEASARCNSDDENVVLNLKVCDASMDNEADPVCPPDAYDSNTTSTFFSKPFEFNANEPLMPRVSSSVAGDFPAPITDAFDINPNNQHAHTHTHTHTHSHTALNIHDPSLNPAQKAYRVVNLLKDFEERNKANEWPSTTSIHCYWCCHMFKNVPFGIPIKYVDGKFHVIGCFCSLECAAAHNMHHHDSADEMWERYMLINMLSRKLDHRDIVKPAPPRLALKAFGGHMDIEEFREYFKTNKVINVNFPPMMTLTQQLEEVNESDITGDLKYIPIDTERINKYKEKMKLRRTKPIANFRNTLDHTMNLKITA